MKYLVIFLLVLNLQASQRCQKYIQAERTATFAVFGIDFPYWYAVGQLQQESNCRNVISRDGVGSQGVAQITYRIWKNFLNKKGIPNLNTTRNQLHAQAFIMADAKKQAYSSHLWVAYQVYNGGSLVNKEITRARKALDKREISHAEARPFCKRKIIHFNNGQSISACDINYDYSEKIYKYGNMYNRLNLKTKYIFW